MSTVDPAARNIQTIAALEEEALRQRTTAERFSDRITKVIGSMTFVGVHLVVFALWFLVNVNLIPGLAPFDPFPFGILTLIVSTEGVLLAIFILISQNRMSRQSDIRDHLALQISLLSEQEMTKLLRMVEQIRAHLGVERVEDDKIIETLVSDTDVNRLVREIEEKLPNQ
ncbi:MAG: DUF1003 domain-containing protein [Blastocatellia bacterium]